MTYDESEKLKKLYQIYEQPMYRIAFSILHRSQQAEDAVSDSFIRIIKNLRKIDEPDSEKTKAYIVKIIKSASISQYRKNARSCSSETPIDDETMQIPDHHQSADSNVKIFELKSDIAQLLDSLKSTDRDIVLLRCKNELPWKEVAERVSMTEENVRKHFERARKKLMTKRGEMLNEEQNFTKR